MLGHAGEQTNEVICWQHLWINSIKAQDFSKLLQKDMMLPGAPLCRHCAV